MASKKFRIIVNLLILLLILFLGFIFMGSIFLLILQIVPLVFIIFFIPLWLIIIILEREFVWTLLFLIKKEPYRHLSISEGKHEEILDNYLNKSKSEI
jgi:hypothetical protein